MTVLQELASDPAFSTANLDHDSRLRGDDGGQLGPRPVPEPVVSGPPGPLGPRIGAVFPGLPQRHPISLPNAGAAHPASGGRRGM